MEQIFQAKWKIGEDTKDFPIRTKIVRVIDDAPNEPYELDVCDVLPSVRKKQHVKLIASAPELLRACNFALQGIKNGQVDELTIKILEDAISGAVGEK